MFNLSSAQGARFAEIVKIMEGRLEKIGPSPLGIHYGGRMEGIEDLAGDAVEQKA
jgi:hypothetical protein